MNAPDLAAQVLAGGLGEIRTAFPYALAAALAALTAAGIFFVLLFKGRARWRAVRGEAGDGALPMFFEKRPKYGSQASIDAAYERLREAERRFTGEER
jgi:hypothetical protein